MKGATLLRLQIVRGLGQALLDSIVRGLGQALLDSMEFDQFLIAAVLFLVWGSLRFSVVMPSEWTCVPLSATNTQYTASVGRLSQAQRERAGVSSGVGA